ncbi:helix-turn-helix transcriptional regulator [Butyrivibrio sp. NC3005]|uniref:helix-turn-helix transcriptional regulator n=1 Tax=Butyrivibrio sp. NC3005 TaxID=1280685 RepID=UPI0003F793EB|nr:helix-turn-helix transcriptional regulator [Butyrivibrio sp. NC3005]
MRIMLGNKIKELRKRDRRTQDDLATALGITNQAVSRWEANKAYPDMEMIPAIANYFHVSIDELFGYNNDRESTLSRYIEKANRLLEPGVTPDKKQLKRHEQFLREALSEFPNEWHLQERLAMILSMIASNDKRKKNETAALKEAAKLYEQAYQNCDDIHMKELIHSSLIGVLGRLRDYQKIEEIALQSSSLSSCRELVRTVMIHDSKYDRYVSEALLSLLHQLADLLDMNFEHFATANNPDIYLSLAMLYKSTFGDGNYGWFNSDICLLYLNAARICNRNKDYKQTSDCFGKAYEHGTSFMEAAKEPIKRPTNAGVSDAVELPSRFVYISESLFKQYIGLFSEDVISKLRSNPKYAAIL